MPGILQAFFYTNDQTKRSSQDLPQYWSLPAVILPASVKNEFQHPVILHERIARALGLMEGDSVTFQLSDYTAGANMMAMVDSCFHGWVTGGVNHHNHQQENCSNSNGGFVTLKISIDPSASFDVAIEANSESANHTFGGTLHNPMGNFLVCSGLMLKLNEQSIFRSHKTSKDLKCSGMLLQVEGLIDSFDGAGCGYCIYASSPLSRPKSSDLMVQGYRYLGANISNPQEATYFGLLEALQWVNRLDFQIVWIVGSSQDVFRQVHSGESSDSAIPATATSLPTTPMMRYLHKQVVDLLEQARKRRIQFKFLASDETDGASIDLATRAVVQRQNETWCHWATINYQCQRPLPFSKSLARQVSI